MKKKINWKVRGKRDRAMSFTWTLNISNFCFFFEKVRKANVGGTFRIKLKFNGFEFHVGFWARGAFHNLYALETRNDHTRKRSGSKSVSVQIISYETPEKLHKFHFKKSNTTVFAILRMKKKFMLLLDLHICRTEFLTKENKESFGQHRHKFALKIWLNN